MGRMMNLLVLFVLFTGCEDVIQVDVPSEEPRLIVDALIRIDESEQALNVEVKVSLTSSFFGTIPATGLGDITIINLDGPTTMCANCLILKEKTPGSGVYEEVGSPDFFMDGELIIQLKHEDRRYFARTRYVPAVPIDTVEQGDGTLFGSDDTELIVTFTDAPDREDFYVFDFDFGRYLVTEDEFYQGQEFSFSYFYDQKFEPGEEIAISIMGADRTFYNYMNLLIDQSEDEFDIFDTPVATVRGNIFDVTELDNIDVFDNVDQPDVFPLGYFAVVQVYNDTITMR
ncbi:MAG TPA: DUF4249 family protein [Eudoraea sp.]|nr:DUF4249 family protein [Eudoraea sp.]